MVPLKSDAQRIALRLQVSTGMELSADGEIQALDSRTWQERRNTLAKLADTPRE